VKSLAGRRHFWRLSTQQKVHVLETYVISTDTKYITATSNHFNQSGRYTYEGESKIIRNVATYCAVGYTAGWSCCDTCGQLASYCCGADVTFIVDLCHEFCVMNLDGPLFICTKEEQSAVILFL
jgi:hypothetical protein